MTIYTDCAGACVYRAVDNEIQILLIQDKRNTWGRYAWGIPKGHREEGETLEECAHREVKEETGASVVLQRSRRKMRLETSSRWRLLTPPPSVVLG